MTTRLRASSTDRIIACAGSTLPVEHPYNPVNPEATEGTAGHEALAYVVDGKEPPIEEIASKHNVDADDIAYLARRGTAAWDEVRQWFPGARSEVQMSEALSADVELRGTSDVVGADGDTASVLDWKLGWQPSEHPGQLKSYASLARACHDSGAESVTAIEVWVRPGVLRIDRYTRDDLASFRDQLLAQVDRGASQWGPGPVACQYCPRQNSCVARDEWLRGSVAALAPVADNQPVTPETIGALYPVAKQLRAALARYDKALDAMLLDGPVPDGNGGRIEYVEKSQDHITASGALPVITETLGLTPAECDAVVSIAKTKLAAVMKQRAPARQGAAYMRRAMDALREADAIETVTKRQKTHTKGDGS